MWFPLLGGVDMAWLAKATFEVNCLALFAVCFVHSMHQHGWRRTLREFSAGFFLTAVAESTGVLSGAYVYPGFYLYILATPVANPASWVALIYIVMTLSDRIVFGQKALGVRASTLQLKGGLIFTICVLACFDASLALLLDLVLDPLATVFNWWIWVPSAADVLTVQPGRVHPYNFEHLVWMATPDNPVAEFFAPFFDGGFRYPTRFLSIPLINFVAWFVFVFTFAWQFRWVEGREWSHSRKTIVLWSFVCFDAPVLGFCLIAPNL